MTYNLIIHAKKNICDVFCFVSNFIQLEFSNTQVLSENFLNHKELSMINYILTGWITSWYQGRLSNPTRQER